ncbi:MAG TPA: hypothetical protein VMJ73_15455 [Rhizomicrobium sp.]|nr:hypothetical protein [Rhizomicrobium sp.]
MIVRTLIAATTAALLASCAYEGHGDRVAVGANVGYYDGYYDGYYGPFYDGYWGTDGFFYYSDANGHNWTRDDAHHFRRDAQTGFNPVHGRGERHDDMPSHP